MEYMNVYYGSWGSCLERLASCIDHVEYSEEVTNYRIETAYRSLQESLEL